MTTSVILTGPLVWLSRSASWAVISWSMASVIMTRKALISALSHAACKDTKFALADLRKPSASKSAGMPQLWEPPKPEPIIDPAADGAALRPVSYTHLRAHETRHD